MLPQTGVHRGSDGPGRRHRNSPCAIFHPAGSWRLWPSRPQSLGSWCWLPGVQLELDVPQWNCKHYFKKYLSLKARTSLSDVVAVDGRKKTPPTVHGYDISLTATLVHSAGDELADTYHTQWNIWIEEIWIHSAIPYWDRSNGKNRRRVALLPRRHPADRPGSWRPCRTRSRNRSAWPAASPRPWHRPLPSSSTTRLWRGRRRRRCDSERSTVPHLRTDEPVSAIPADCNPQKAAFSLQCKKYHH